MGCGKSVLGKQLAETLQRSFVDTDQLVCRRTGLSVAGIFDQFGELEFRRLESEVLLECAAEQNQVVATGGGIVEQHGNLDLMLQTGLVVYLNLPVEELVNRLLDGREKRPLIRDKSAEELHAFIAVHLKQRSPLYEQAHLIFDATKSVEALMQKIENYSM